jgi:hypothetical protein
LWAAADDGVRVDGIAGAEGQGAQQLSVGVNDGAGAGDDGALDDGVGSDDDVVGQLCFAGNDGGVVNLHGCKRTWKSVEKGAAAIIRRRPQGTS